jgi:hypothetical protein
MLRIGLAYIAGLIGVGLEVVRVTDWGLGFLAVAVILTAWQSIAGWTRR